MPRQRDGVRKAAGTSNGASHGSLSAEGREATHPRHAVGASPSCPQVRGDRRAFALLPAGGCPHTPLQRPWALPARSGPSSPRPRSPQGEAGAAAVLPPPAPRFGRPRPGCPAVPPGPLTVDDEFLGVTLEVLPLDGAEAGWEAALGQQPVDVLELAAGAAGLGRHHLLLGHLQRRVHGQHGPGRAKARLDRPGQAGTRRDETGRAG